MTRSEAIELSNPILHPIERKVFSYIRHNYCMGSTRWQFVISRLHLAPKKMMRGMVSFICLAHYAQTQNHTAMVVVGMI